MALEQMIEKLKGLGEKNIVVLGDYCLDKYMYSDPAEDDVSVETGKAAWQVYDKKMAAGVAGTITNNLCALGAKVTCVGFVGDDGEGYELRKELEKLGVNTEYMVVTDELVTATYLKTMRKKPDGGYEEDLRFDLRNRTVASQALFEKVVENFEKAVERADGVIISDQYYEANSGLVGDYVRQRVNEIARERNVPILVDSRAFAAEFKNMSIKCNNYELMKYCGINGDPENRDDVIAGSKKLRETLGKTVFITCNKDGILIFDEDVSHVPAYPVSGELDVTGCGDASNAGIMVGLSLGLTPVEAAMIACSVSSITIKQIGVTGTADMDSLISRLKELNELM